MRFFDTHESILATSQRAGVEDLFRNKTRMMAFRDRQNDFRFATDGLGRPSYNSGRCFGTLMLVLAVVGVLWGVTSAGAFDGDADGFVRPWESRPYQVLVWICSSSSPEIASVLPQTEIEIERRAELADPSAWNVNVETAPGAWRSRLLEMMDQGTEIEGLAEAEVLVDYDKMIAVCLTHQDGSIRYQVREFDVQTGQWGAPFDRRSGSGQDLAGNIYNAIERVFMPLARIERVSEQGEVFLRARAINACITSDALDISAAPVAIENSPVWVRREDRLLPIIRKVDRNGDLAQLEPIPFTFLTVEEQTGSRLVCDIQSRQRSALGGRSSKRAQKLALVIRPPESSTELKLVSQENDSRPLSGYEIYSRRPQQDADEDSEFLGLTDWRGVIEIPPCEDGLRLIYVKRGTRPLMKLPIIPGLYESVVTPGPDDEARLAAAGIAEGFQIEILNLVAQRELHRSQINSAVDEGKVEDAKLLYQQFQRLETPQDLKIRLANEESRLRTATSNERERDRIQAMFQQLLAMVNSQVTGSFESDLQAKIQNSRAESESPR